MNKTYPAASSSGTVLSRIADLARYATVPGTRADVHVVPVG